MNCRPPDYTGGGVVNLLAAIIAARGGRSPHARLAGLDLRVLRQARKLIYLVVDGLGAEQLREYLAQEQLSAFFAAHPWREISTVFPATTAAAITTFSTGATPAEHGILGWHLHLADLGLVGTILPVVTRTGVPLADARFNLARYLRLPVYLDSIRGGKQLLSYGAIPFSRFSRAGGRWRARHAFSALAGLVRQTLRFARGGGRQTAYVYWPEYDSCCHEYGTAHRKPLAHLRRIDCALAGLARRLAGTGAVLLVTADHGLVDTPLSNCVDLRQIPGLFECLTVLPSGDARCLQCFVRPARVREFLRLARSRLGRIAWCLSGRELLESGWLGPGRPHPALASRVGDFVLLARPGCALGCGLPGVAPEFHRANHGGMSAREMRVPLYVVGGKEHDESAC